MKTLIKYFRKREETISFLLEKPKRSYTPATFHKLRVEIKKLNALFKMMNFCSKDFKRNKAFKPFKLIFRRAGKVRELHVEEAMLKKYFFSHLLKDYRNNLKKLLLEEQEAYFSVVNKKFVTGLNKKYRDIEPFLAQIDKKKLNSYMEKSRIKIKKLLCKNTLQTSQLHELRKRIKKFNYNRKILDSGKQNKSLPEKDILPELLGKWHDCRVTIGYLEKTMDKDAINPKEASQLKKVKSKIASESNILFDKIYTAIPESEFFTD